MRYGFIIWMIICSLGCSTTRPCTEGGDITWRKVFKGNRHCYKKTLDDGQVVNHGEYIEEYPNGKIAIKGAFKDGKKHGVWIEYNEKEEPVMEKYFHDGVDKPVPPPKE